MKSLDDVIFYESLPKIDLHGYDSQTARVAINDFVNDNKKTKQEVFVIMHGNGSGILQKTTDDVLRKNKNVIEFKRTIGNTGCTLVRIKFDIDK